MIADLHTGAVACVTCPWKAVLLAFEFPQLWM